MNASEFYEQYWRQPEADPESGQLVGERKALLKVALNHLPPRAKVLDIGCGSGLFTAFLEDMGFDVVGVDISETAVRYARQRYAGVRFETASVEQGLSFKNDEFDIVWCSEVLEHLFDVGAALTEISRVLRPGGKFVLTTPYHGLVKNLIVCVLAFERHYDPCGPHIRFFTRRSLKLCLEKAGFTVERWGGVGRFWPVWMSHFVVARKVSMLNDVREGTR
jgi:2-polyprenyl-3-methyl-5-hydroxy-6-metoxy-1,4-benzoquinol methylase